MPFCFKCKQDLPDDLFKMRPDQPDRPRSYCVPCAQQYFWELNLRKYNLTPEQYAAILAGQAGRCAICGTDQPGGRDNAWCIDHDHECCPGRGSCGKCIRGFLCQRCNTALGWIQDRWDLAHKLYEYLDKHLHLKMKERNDGANQVH